MKTTNFHGSESSKISSVRLSFLFGLKGVRLCLLLILMLTFTGCGWLGSRGSGKSYVINGKRYYILASANGFREKGQASWYGEPFHGRKTASGEVYDMNKISAAHKTLPLHTWVEVKNLDNNKAMTVRVNDRGPFVKGRIIDLSRAAAQELGMLNAGLARVRIRAITGQKAAQLAAEEQRRKTVTVAAAAPAAVSAPLSAAPSAGADRDYGVLALVTDSSMEAERHRKKLAKDYSLVNIDTRINGRETAFSVRIDGLENRKAAAEVKARLAKLGYQQAQVVDASR